MAFPVGLFWLFNQPAFFEDWMVEQRVISLYIFLARHIT